MHKILVAIVSIYLAAANLAKAQPFEKELWDSRLDLGYEWLKEGCYLEVLDSCFFWQSSLQLPLDRQAEVLTLKGNAYRRMELPENAIKCHQAALNIRTKHFGANSIEVARSCQNLFNTYWDLGNYRQAVVFAKRNLEIRQAALPTSDAGLVVPTMILGDAVFKLGREQEAKLLFQDALEIQVRSAGYAAMNTANLQVRIAECLFSDGIYYQALDSLQTAWRFMRVAKETTASDKARCLFKLGDCLLEIGDSESALQHYQTALDYCQDGDAERVGVLLSLGKLHGLRREPMLASEYFEEAVLLCEASSSKLSPEVSKMYLDGLLQLGGSYLAIGELAGAVFYVEKCIAKIPNGQGYGELLTSAHLKLGRCKLQMGNRQAAAHAFQQALRWATANGDAAKVFSANYYLGEVAKIENELTKAILFYKRALIAIDKAGAFPYEAIQAKAALALAHGAFGQRNNSGEAWLTAKNLALEGIKDLQGLKWRLSDEQSEMDAQASFFQLYNMAIAATLALKGADAAEEAYKLAEQYRGSQFIRLSNQAQEADGQDSAEAKVRQLRRSLAVARQRRSAMPGSPTFLLQQDEAKRLDSLILGIQQQLSGLEKPTTQQPTSPPTAIASAMVRKRLAANQTLLEYHWGEQQLFAFVFTSDTFFVKTLPLPKGLDTDILKFFSFCNQNPEWVPDGQQTFLPRLSHQLYINLLAPLKPWLRPNLTIVPDAWLHYLPFDALVTVLPSQPDYYWEYQYLAKSYSIGYANAVYTYKGAHDASIPYETALTAVAPRFEHDGRLLTPLFNNEKEALAAKKILGGRLLKGGLATKMAALSTMQSSQVMLFSTHSILNDQRPVSSYLAFTEEPDTVDNENLYAWEIYNLGFHTDLVVLSACQTANGQLYRGEGLMSMARAFQFAGAKTVVASLWNVDDKQTPVLMEAYFSNLAAGVPKAKALSDAKKHYLNHAPRLKTHPFFWSGFISIGDDSPLSAKKRPWGLYALIGGLFLLSILCYKLLRG